MASKVKSLAIMAYGQIDGLVVNHGALEPIAKLENCSIDDFKKLYDVNVFSAFNVVGPNRYLVKRGLQIQPLTLLRSKRLSQSYARPRAALSLPPQEPQQKPTKLGDHMAHQRRP